ncbi:MAG: hypothetical protein ACYS1A_16355 [Planctomycetota bacterium]
MTKNVSNKRSGLPAVFTLSMLVLCAASCTTQRFESVKVRGCSSVSDVEPPVSLNVIRQSRERKDLLDENSPKGLRVVQITTDSTVGSHNVYMESQIFTLDSKRFIFVRGRDYWLCDIEDDFSLVQVTDEKRAKGPAVSPDGKWMYYLVDKTLEPEGVLKLKRLSLENFTREVLLVLDGPIPGTNYKPSRIYSLSSISSDGRKLCTSAFLGDGKTENAPFGLLVFDLENLSVKLIFKGKHFNNMHPQYSHSIDPVLSRDIMIQHNHGSIIDLNGKAVKLVGGKGADLHIIKDDGTNWRDIPTGRDGIQYNSGHQQWRGKMGSVLSSVHHGKMTEQKGRPLLEGWPIRTDEDTSHKGSNIDGGRYVDVMRNLERPDVPHFSLDVSGMHVVFDSYRVDDKTGKTDIILSIGTLSREKEPVSKIQYILNSGTSGRGQPAHVHPFFSPDSRMIFFNSDVDGIPQIFMVTGYEFPEFG